jgi:hypothetical protein
MDKWLVFTTSAPHEKANATRSIIRERKTGVSESFGIISGHMNTVQEENNQAIGKVCEHMLLLRSRPCSDGQVSIIHITSNVHMLIKEKTNFITPSN